MQRREDGGSGEDGGDEAGRWYRYGDSNPGYRLRTAIAASRPSRPTDRRVHDGCSFASPHVFDLFPLTA